MSVPVARCGYGIVDGIEYSKRVRIRDSVARVSRYRIFRRGRGPTGQRAPRVRAPFSILLDPAPPRLTLSLPQACATALALIDARPHHARLGCAQSSSCVADRTRAGRARARALLHPSRSRASPSSPGLRNCSFNCSCAHRCAAASRALGLALRARPSRVPRSRSQSRSIRSGSASNSPSQ